MESKDHDSSDTITEDAIREAFANADSIRFAARNWNVIKYRMVAFGGLRWLPLKYVLEVIGITPQMLRPVFNPQREWGKRRFPLNLSWFGLNSKQYEWRDVELPKIVDNYEQLGSFPTTKEHFQKVRKVFGKAIEVYKEDGSTGQMTYLGTVHLSGQIETAKNS